MAVMKWALERKLYPRWLTRMILVFMRSSAPLVSRSEVQARTFRSALFQSHPSPAH